MVDENLSKKKKDKGNPQEIKAKNDLLKELQRTGEYDRLKHDLYAKLMLDDRWKEEIFQQAQQAVQSSGGVAELTMDSLSSRCIAAGNRAISDSIKKETMDSIRKACNLE